MPELTVSAPAPSTAVPSAAPAAGASFSFHELLSELNPLQYIPVVGTIYRSVTGDTIPEAARIAGSLVFSGLTGGPIGLALNLAMTAVQKATGLDAEAIGHDALASIGIGTPSGAGPPDPPAPATAPPSPAAPVADAGAPAGGASGGWSRSQLTAYGIVSTADGQLRRGDLAGSDVLNDLVLARNGGGGGTMLALL